MVGKRRQRVLRGICGTVLTFSLAYHLFWAYISVVKVSVGVWKAKLSCSQGCFVVHDLCIR